MAIESETDRVASELALLIQPGEVVFLKGPLGVGKTRFVKGFAKSLGFEGQVKSPTFNLVLLYDSDPPILHSDLYRVQSASGLGIEDYLDDHICMIEWPERDPEFFAHCPIWILEFEFDGDGRTLKVFSPSKMKDK